MHSFRSRGIGIVVSLGRALARRETLRQKPKSDEMLAARMKRVLLTIESDTFADARSCPICHASPRDTNPDEALAHVAGCELDASGSRREPGSESY
jgi:hypothetical protein